MTKFGLADILGNPPVNDTDNWIPCCNALLETCTHRTVVEFVWKGDGKSYGACEIHWNQLGHGGVDRITRQRR
jgi:hypothetical protein